MKDIVEKFNLSECWCVSGTDQNRGIFFTRYVPGLGDTKTIQDAERVAKGRSERMNAAGGKTTATRQVIDPVLFTWKDVP